MLWAGHPEYPGHFDAMDDTVPLGAAGTPDDVAAALVALAGLADGSGTTLVVDGAQVAYGR